MILFVAPYPNQDNEKDGMIQRIREIDNIYSDITRVYIDISFHRYIKKYFLTNGSLTIYRLNFFIHILTIINLIITANIVYVHSILFSLKILPAYYFKKIITDMHGAVPEERLFRGSIILSKLFDIVERMVVNHSYKIISVSKEMSKHFSLKHARDTSQDLLIPIINLKKQEEFSHQKTKYTNKTPLVIYAGGLMKWQNVHLMLDAVKKNKECRYRFLTTYPDELEKMATSVGIDSLDIQSVPSEIVFEHYKEADYGFLLRDEHLLNKVSCPTKAMEYMMSGVLPIVLSEEIGDFNDMGYNYLKFNDFLSGILPGNDEYEKMTKKNIAVISDLSNIMKNGIMALRALTLPYH